MSDSFLSSKEQWYIYISPCILDMRYTIFLYIKSEISCTSIHGTRDSNLPLSLKSRLLDCRRVVLYWNKHTNENLGEKEVCSSKAKVLSKGQTFNKPYILEWHLRKHGLISKLHTCVRQNLPYTTTEKPYDHQGCWKNIHMQARVRVDEHIREFEGEWIWARLM